MLQILACRANHDTVLRIQQDFTSTMANVSHLFNNKYDFQRYLKRFSTQIVGISGEKKSDDNKENDFDIEKHSNRKHPLDDEVPDNADNEIPVDLFPSEDNDVDEEHEAIYIRYIPSFIHNFDLFGYFLTLKFILLHRKQLQI